MNEYGLRDDSICVFSIAATLLHRKLQSVSVSQSIFGLRLSELRVAPHPIRGKFSPLFIGALPAARRQYVAHNSGADIQDVAERREKLPRPDLFDRGQAGQCLGSKQEHVVRDAVPPLQQSCVADGGEDIGVVGLRRRQQLA
eukprot:362619-Chlamydomonas_euryale.AAC.4